MKRLFWLLVSILVPVGAHATVIPQFFSQTYTCTGSTGPFPFNYPLSAPPAMTVTKNGVLLASTAYTIVPINNNYDNGGSITLLSACAAGQTLVLKRATPLTQTQVFTDNMPVPMKSFENGLDKLTEIMQEQAARIIDITAGFVSGDCPNLVFTGGKWVFQDSGGPCGTGGGGGSGCSTGGIPTTSGSVTGDITSTNCGADNRVGDAIPVPANTTTLGYTNLTNAPNTAGGQIVAVGNTNFDSVTGGLTDLIAVGRDNGHQLDSNNNVIAIGNQNASFYTGDNTVAIGDDSVRYHSTGSSDIVAIGGAAARNVGSGMTPPVSTQLIDAVCVGDQPCRDIGGNNLIGIGTSLYGYPYPTDPASGLAEVVGVGDGNFAHIGADFSDGVAMGDANSVVGGTGQLTGGDLVTVGDSNANMNNDKNLHVNKVVGLGSGNLLSSGAATAYNWHWMVGIGEGNGIGISTGDNVFAGGNGSATFIGQTSTSLTDAVALGDGNVNVNTGAHALVLSDMVGVGDGNASTVLGTSDDFVGIGNGNGNRYTDSNNIVGIGQGNASNVSSTITNTDIAGIGHSTCSFLGTGSSDVYCFGHTIGGGNATITNSMGFGHNVSLTSNFATFGLGVKVADGSGQAGQFQPAIGTDPGGVVGTATYMADTTNGYAMIHEGTAAASRACTAANGVCSTGATPTINSTTSDTVASVNTACASGCTYMVNPSTGNPTFTLAGNLALNANVNVTHVNGGFITVNGAFTLTINGNVSGPPTKLFAGTSTIKLGALVALAPVEWFGAVGDYNGTTGTDNTTAIQKTSTALTVGQVALQNLCYKVTSAITSTGSVGLAGLNRPGLSALSSCPAPVTGTIVQTSASADIWDASSVNQAIFEKFALKRSVAPTGSTSSCFLLSSASQVVIRSTEESNCIYPIHLVSAASVQQIDNITDVGVDGITLAAGNYAGIFMDSISGSALDSDVIIQGATVAVGASGTVIVDGILHKGAHLNDLSVRGWASAGVTNGVHTVYTGGTSFGAAADIHYSGLVNDSYLSNCFLISGLAAGATPSVNITDGWCASQVASAQGIEIDSSTGVTVTGVQMLVKTNGVVVNTGALISVADSYITINDAAGYGIKCVACTNSNFTGSNIAGTGLTGISLDSGSTGNAGFETNTVSGTFTNTLVDAAAQATNTAHFLDQVFVKQTGNNFVAEGTDNASFPSYNMQDHLHVNQGVFGYAELSSGVGFAGKDYFYGGTNDICYLNSTASACTLNIVNGTGITVTGSVKSSTLGSAMTKSVSGVLTNAVAGTDYAAASISNAITTATGGSGTGTVTCATAACTNLRGSYTVAGGTFATGTLLALVWPTTTTAYVCSASVLNNATGASIGYHSIATATGMNITSLTAATGLSVDIDYNCQP